MRWIVSLERRFQALKLCFMAILLLIVALASPVNGTIERFETVMDLNQSVVGFTITILYPETPTGTMEIPLFFSTERFEHSANFRGHTCRKEDPSWGTRIFCDFSGTSRDGRAISFRLTSRDVLKDIDNGKYFSASLKVPEFTKVMYTRARLARGFVLIPKPDSPTALQPFIPKDGVEGSDGQRIYVTWERGNVTAGEGIDVSVAYEKLAEDDTGTLLLLVTGLLALTVIVVIIWRRGGKEFAEIAVLKEDEKKVIEILRNQGGRCNQKLIVQSTDFSKAKVSRLLKDLEERGLVGMKRLGRVNEVSLTKPGDKEKAAETPEPKQEQKPENQENP